MIEEISRIDSTRCRYNFNGVKNVDTVTESYSVQISGRIPGVDEILKLAEYFNNFFFRMILPQRKLGQDLL